MEPEEPTQAQKYFNRKFSEQQTDLRGSEEEIIVYKRMAYRWYLVGRASMIEQLRQQVVKQLDTVNDMQRQLEGE